MCKNQLFRRKNALKANLEVQSYCCLSNPQAVARDHQNIPCSHCTISSATDTLRIFACNVRPSGILVGHCNLNGFPLNGKPDWNSTFTTSPVMQKPFSLKTEDYARSTPQQGLLSADVSAERWGLRSGGTPQISHQEKIRGLNLTVLQQFPAALPQWRWCKLRLQCQELRPPSTPVE